GARGEPGGAHPPPRLPSGEGVGGRGVSCLRGSENLRSRPRRARRRRAAPAATMATQPPTDHGPAVSRRPSATARVEALGDAAHLGAPRAALVEPLLGLLGHTDPRAASFLTEPG